MVLLLGLDFSGKHVDIQPSDGWCIQSGRISGTGAVYTITFLKPFANTNYIAFKNDGENSNNSVAHCHVSCYNLTKTTMQTYGLSGGTYACWQAAGYIEI